MLRALHTLAVCVAGLSFAFSATVRADMLEQRAELINRYVTDMHADPLVADCAAHGNFIASTTDMFDHVEYTPDSFTSDNATITPWNDSFDEGKQRVKVDSIVTVSGIGIRTNGAEPVRLHFRCGYVGTQMLAFSWNDPVPLPKPHAERRHSSKKGKHHAVKGKSRTRAKVSGTHGKKTTSSKKSRHTAHSR